MPDLMVAVAEALAKLDMRPGDRVLVMLPDGPGFAEALAAATHQGAMPLPVDPLLPARDVGTVAAAAAARLVLLPADRIEALADLGSEPPVLVHGPEGAWAAALRLR